MFVHAFFHGLDGDGVADTIREYQDADVGWHVHTIGTNLDGSFWLLMVRTD